MENIAEGFERGGNKEFVNFLFIAKGSCGEVRSQLIRANDVGYFTPDEYNELYNDCRKLSAAIINFIKEVKCSEMLGSKYKPWTFEHLNLWTILISNFEHEEKGKNLYQKM